jgi:hypothetical protein
MIPAIRDVTPCRTIREPLGASGGGLHYCRKMTGVTRCFETSRTTAKQRPEPQFCCLRPHSFQFRRSAEPRRFSHSALCQFSRGSPSHTHTHRFFSLRVDAALRHAQCQLYLALDAGS